jgi:hypothetical protein
MFKEMPKQYLERPDGGPLCQAWNDAVDAATLTHLAMQKLGDMLRRKANIAEPGPYEELIVAEGKTYEPTPEGWNLASACVGIVRRRAQVDIDPDNRTGAAHEHVQRTGRRHAMAGRPMRKAEQVTALEDKMCELRELMDEVCELFDDHMPDHYNDRTPTELSRDPRGKAWVDASEAIDHASDLVGDLGDILREKAGITLEEAKAAIAEQRGRPARAETVATGG